MRTLFYMAVLSGLLVGIATVAAQEHTYPIGTVIAPDGNNVPTRPQQKLFYKWAAQIGLNAIEHEQMPVAGGYFDWGLIQPTPDTWRWEPYDASVEDSEEAGLDVYLEIFTYRGLPQWLYDKYPDAYMMTPLGGSDTLTPVKRDDKLDLNAFPSLAHPGFSAAAESYARTIAKRYRDRKRVRGYLIAEELGLPGIWPYLNYYGIDFSPAVRDAYHARLKQKFSTIDALNKAWDTPGRYQSFDQVVWRKGWSHEPKQYRGEWLEYYLTLQQVVADHHNRLARAIREEDPDAIIMVSDFQPMVNRVGHGSYAALLTDIDAFAFKSYWNDTRMQTDFCTGITGGNKQVWCTNFSEAETTRGDETHPKRYMLPEYVARQFWPSYARGLDGLFAFIFMPTQAEKMSLTEPRENGTIAPIPAIHTLGALAEFMNGLGKELTAFTPEAAHVVVHDPNVTFIGQHWDHADATKVREKWFSETAAISAYQTTFDDMAKLNRRFTVSTETTIAQHVDDPQTKLLCLAGNDLFTESTATAVKRWLTAGKPAIIDERTGTLDDLSRPTDWLGKLRNGSNVLVLRGNRWDRDPAERARLETFTAKHLPLRYSEASGKDHTTFTVDYLDAADGRELAIITRRGTSGRLGDELSINLKWDRSHSGLKLLDPSAVPSRVVQGWTISTATESTVTLQAFQDALLVIAK